MSKTFLKPYTIKDLKGQGPYRWFRCFSDVQQLLVYELQQKRPATADNEATTARALSRKL